VVVFVTGVNGQLGFDLINELNIRNIVYYGCDISESSTLNNYFQVDINDIKSIDTLFDRIKPDVIIHCAGWTNVEAAEDENNKKIVYEVNVLGTRNLALLANKYHSKFVYISTDYVFDNNDNIPHKEDDINFNPLNYYGLTKLLGENEVRNLLTDYFIVRISWAFGINGNNFIKKIIELGKNNSEVNVVSDQVGSLTYTYDLAILLCDMILTNKYGTYHATSSGEYVSWYDIAKETYLNYGLNTKVLPCLSKDFASKVTRPKNSRLSKDKIVLNGFKPLRDWKEALKEYVSILKKNDFWLCLNYFEFIVYNIEVCGRGATTSLTPHQKEKIWQRKLQKFVSYNS